MVERSNRTGAGNLPASRKTAPPTAPRCLISCPRRCWEGRPARLSREAAGAAVMPYTPVTYDHTYGEATATVGFALARPVGPNAGWTPRRRLDDVFCGPFRRRRALRMWKFSTTRAKQNILVPTIRAPVCGPRAEQPESTLERARGKNNCPARVTSGAPKSTPTGPSFSGIAGWPTRSRRGQILHADAMTRVQ